MTFRVPGPVVLVFVAGLALGSWWLANRESDREAPAAAAARAPAYYLRDAVVEQTDETGRVDLRVTAARAAQDPATRNVRLEALRVDYFLVAPDRTWVMTAANGMLPPDSRVVLLEGDVRLKGVDAGSPDAATIRTERLRFDVERSLATTAEPVRIELASHAIDGRGLRADLRNDRIELESEVHGRFQP